jgi:hypothetical protein
MKKKNIVSVLLAGTLLGGFAVTFTGCIDNDEPEGIKVLREAKAGLLTAKTALASAQAEYQKALAQAALAKAEVEQAEAEIKKIQAEATAQADLLKAQAEAAKTQAEADSIKAAAAAAEAESAAKIAKIQAQTQAVIEESAEKLKSLQYATQQAEIAYKKDLLSLEASKAGYIEGFYSAYIAAQEKYQTAYEAYIKAQEDYLLALADADYKGETSNLAKRYKFEKTLKQKVADAEDQLAEDQEALETYTQALADADGLTPSALQDKYTQYKADVDSLTALNSLADLKRAEAQKENIEEYDKLGDLKGELTALTSDNEEKNLVVAAYSYTLPEAVINYSAAAGQALSDEEVVVFKAAPNETTFWLNSSKTPSDSYDNALEALKTHRTKVAGLVYDSNDAAWGQAIINEYKADIVELQKAFAEDSLDWVEAKNVYNSGNGTDITKFTRAGYPDYAAALTEYNSLVGAANEAIAAYNALLDKQEAAQAEIDAANQALTDLRAQIDETPAKSAKDYYDEAVAAAKDAFNKAKDDAKEARQEAIKANKVVYNSAVKEAKDAYDNAVLDKKVADYNYQAAYKLNETNPSTENAAAVTAASTAQTTAQQKVDKAVEDKNTAETKAADAQAKADGVAWSEYYTALADAQTEYNKAIVAAQKEYNTALANNTLYAEAEKNNTDLADAQKKIDDLTKAKEDGIDKDVEEAEDALYDESEESTSALTICNNYFKNEFIEAQSAFVAAVGSDNLSNIADDDARRNDDDELVELESITINNAQAKEVVKTRSNKIYGYGLLGAETANQTSDTFYGIPVEQLNPLTEADVISLVKTYVQGVKDYQVLGYYPSFGEYGEILSKQAKISIIEALVKDPTSIDTILSEIDEQIAALEQQKKDREAEIDAAQLAVYEQEDVIEALEKEVNDEIVSIKKELNIANRLVSAVNTAIGTVTPDTSKDSGDLEKDIWSDATIAAYKEALQDAIDKLTETTIPQDESDLDDRQAELAAYQAGRLAVDEVAKNLMENEERKLAVAEEMVTIRKAALDAAIAYLESME